MFILSVLNIQFKTFETSLFFMDFLWLKHCKYKNIIPNNNLIFWILVFPSWFFNIFKLIFLNIIHSIMLLMSKMKVLPLIWKQWP